MATYLITGIAGFIGSALARAALAQGHRVRGIDNLSTGKRENLAEILPRIDFRQADLLDLAATHDACRGVDYVLHEAAIPSVPKSVLDPLGSNQANVDATVNLLVAARDAKVKRVVYAASSAAYGDTPTLPKREDMPPNPISPYAVAKLASEYYMISFYRCYGLETVCLRYFNIFGPRQDPTSPYSGVLGHGRRPQRMHRLLRVCSCVPGRKQHAGRREGRSAPPPRDALDPHRPLLLGAAGRC